MPHAVGSHAQGRLGHRRQLKDTAGVLPSTAAVRYCVHASAVSSRLGRINSDRPPHCDCRSHNFSSSACQALSATTMKPRSTPDLTLKRSKSSQTSQKVFSMPKTSLVLGRIGTRYFTLRAGEPFAWCAMYSMLISSLAVSSIPLSNDTFQAKEDAITVDRAKVVMDVLGPAREASHNVWLWISEQAAACEFQISALKLRSGFPALPDEVLSDVLEFASYQNDNDEEIAVKSPVNAATTLSHICSRFRTLIMSTFNLWNRISPSMRMEAISSCFTRCGPAARLAYKSSSRHPRFKGIFSRLLEESQLRRISGVSLR